MQQIVLECPRYFEAWILHIDCYPKSKGISVLIYFTPVDKPTSNTSDSVSYGKSLARILNLLWAILPAERSFSSKGSQIFWM